MVKHLATIYLVLSGVVLAQESRCPSGSTCSSQTSCPGFMKKKELLNSYQIKSAPYNNLLSELKSLICNVDKKKICCHAQSQDHSCPAGMECQTENSCQEFSEKRSKLGSFRKGSPQYRELLSQLKSLVCDSKKKLICCRKKFPQNQSAESESPSWVPTKKEGCGVGRSSAGFIVGGNTTELGEFPWAVLVGRRGFGGQIVWKCGGTLINRWYILTAGHCRNGVEVVRVGEWEVVDTTKVKEMEYTYTCTAYSEEQCRRNRGNIRCSEGCQVDRFKGEVDCMVERSGSTMCAERHQDIEVAQVKTHEDYEKLVSGLVRNDIALIKLKKPVELNNFVTPICLGDREENIRLQEFGEPGKERLLSHGRPIVVGWGKTYQESDKDISIVSSASQQKLLVPVLSNQECRTRWNQLYPGLNIRISLAEHVCAGGEEGKDSCKGDSGGPLVGQDSEVSPYVLVGVVSAGTRTCGIGAPAIYTRVAHYRDWIIKNLV